MNVPRQSSFAAASERLRPKVLGISEALAVSVGQRAEIATGAMSRKLAMIQPSSGKANGSQANSSSLVRRPTAVNPPNGVRSASFEQAKGVLMESFGVSAQQADALFHAWARQCERSPELVAEVFFRQVWRGEETCSDRAVARALEHALRHLPEVVARTPADEVARAR
ncbi:ANTAR domain-containing protein [Kribbella turkmenica]|uniref:ANTAR domain-containing protein n=1 Tax=Kribbella turkmenica TaxID=2530375 RepID=A0A4R4X8X4_9ACTN|nr:ANTAR domain-containing protein [Kribbella turkmenica]TDD26769.1 ANTAR domain-containing protein [Kribbella turkmenica]